MSDHTAPERLYALPGDDGWLSPYVGSQPCDGAEEYVHRAEVDALVAAAYEAAAQKAYADAGRFDTPDRIRALTPDDARAALRAHTEAAVRRALEAAINAAHEADSLELTLHGETKIAERIRDLAGNPAQFIGGGDDAPKL